MANKQSGFYTDGHLAWMEKHGQALPYHANHTEDSEENPISKKLESSNPRNWRLEGNLLIADTDFGPLKQFISTDYIMAGIDEKGLPKFKKVVL